MGSAPLHQPEVPSELYGRRRRRRESAHRCTSASVSEIEVSPTTRLPPHTPAADGDLDPAADTVANPVTLSAPSTAKTRAACGWIVAPSRRQSAQQRCRARRRCCCHNATAIACTRSASIWRRSAHGDDESSPRKCVRAAHQERRVPQDVDEQGRWCARHAHRRQSARQTQRRSRVAAWAITLASIGS